MSKASSTSKSKATFEDHKRESSVNLGPAQDDEPSIEAGDSVSWWTVPCLILLMPICSTAIQLPLTPSHGSIPSVEYHQLMFQTCLVLYFAWRMRYTGRTLISFSTRAALIPVFAASIPFIQLHLAFTARHIGPAYSAALIKAVTLVPLQGLLLSVIRTTIGRYIPRWDFIVGLGALALYFGVEYAWNSHQPLILEALSGLVRPYLMLLVSLGFVALLPTRWTVWTLIPILHTIFWNPHSVLSLPTHHLNDMLELKGFSLVARQEGLTGYLSVVENFRDGYRLMRCDHSILGGNWMAGLGSWPGGRNATMQVGRLPEPVYAVFVMLEAVRLVQDKDIPRHPQTPDSRAAALNIGLGIGTTPSAFIAHGIDTTIVELDPVVHRLAIEHFNLPVNHTAYIEDAAVFVKKTLNQSQPKQYDYIVHDVFTGGAEPTSLFTYEFISSLKQLLKSDGTIAINYASDLNLPSTKLVVNTIISVFPNCRLFRDTAEEDGATHVNFVNLVIFCRKEETPFVFREPVAADYLGTSSRKTYLLPKLEIDLEDFVTRNKEKQLLANETLVLHTGKTGELEKWHGLAARRHWEVMRTVLPHEVWELW